MPTGVDASLRVGAVLDGRYRLERLLGEGGMGTVYRAHHLSMDRAVAVKVLRGSLARDPVASRRFALEAKATTKVDSPNAVKVFDFGITAAGEYFMVMEYLDGRTAQRELDIDGPMAMRRALHVARQALAGLAAAHAVGVIHRDVKPENLLLMRVGNDPDVCKVLDFGVAKLMVQAADSGTVLTREGMVFGTPEFMSPEQACGQPLDGRSDLYSLAATLYTLLTGKPLFSGSSAVEILSKQVTAPPPRLIEQRGLHHLHALDQVLQRALAKRPADRHRDAAELAGVLAFLAPASEPTSLAGSPTMSTPALPAAPGATPESPLGVISSAEGMAEGMAEGKIGGMSEARRAASHSPTGASPLFAELAGGAAGATGATPLVDFPGGAPPGVSLPTGFRPAMTGYLPRVSMELELGSPSLEPAPSTQALAPRRRWLAKSVLAATALAGAALGVWILGGGASPTGPATASPGKDGEAPVLVKVTETSAPATIRPAGHPAASDGSGGASPDGSGSASPGGSGSASPGGSGGHLTASDGSGSANGSAVPEDPATPAPPRTVELDKRKLREHLDAARRARDEGNFLRQLTQANLALDLAPRDREALFLRGDAQLTSGDTDKGCKTMARLRNMKKAVERAARAGCQ